MHTRTSGNGDYGLMSAPVTSRSYRRRGGGGRELWVSVRKCQVWDTSLFLPRVTVLDTRSAEVTLKLKVCPLGPASPAVLLPHLPPVLNRVRRMKEEEEVSRVGTHPLARSETEIPLLSVSVGKGTPGPKLEITPFSPGLE